MDFLYTLLVMFATIWIYAYLIKPTNLKKKDLAPESEYPHVAIFKYYCVFAVSLATFLGFGFVMGVALVGLTIVFTWFMVWIMPRIMNSPSEDVRKKGEVRE